MGRKGFLKNTKNTTKFSGVLKTKWYGSQETQLQEPIDGKEKNKEMVLSGTQTAQQAVKGKGAIGQSCSHDRDRTKGAGIGGNMKHSWRPSQKQSSWGKEPGFFPSISYLGFSFCTERKWQPVGKGPWEMFFRDELPPDRRGQGYRNKVTYTRILTIWGW